MLCRSAEPSQKFRAVFSHFHPGNTPTLFPLTPFVESLSASAQDSENSEVFEEMVYRTLERLGFTCTRIGGSGDTDVLITAPVRVVVDAKSTSQKSVNQVNFARVNSHKAEQNADFAAVVGIKFAPAVQRDARLQKVALIEVPILTRLLELYEQYPLPVNRLVSLFQTHGLAGEREVKEIQVELEQQRSLLENVVRVVRTVDTTPRSADEIKGRLDIIAEMQQEAPISRTDLEHLLGVFSTPPFSLFQRDDSKFARELTLPQVVQLLRTVTAMFEGLVAHVQ